MHLRLLLHLFLFMMLEVFSIMGQAAPAQTSIRVVLDDNYPPYIFRDSSGRIQGILKDLWELWQQRTGVAVDFQPMDWGKARSTMETGQADVIDTIFDTQERRKIYDFSRSYATIEVPIFFHKSIAGITDADSLKGFTIGVKDGDACIDYLTARGVSEFKHYPSYESQVKAAIRQEIRILCIDKPPAIYFFNREGVTDEFRHSPPLYVGEFHWAVAKGNTDLKHLVEEGFSRITADERAAIETRWLGEKLVTGPWSGVARYGGYALFAVLLLIVALFSWNWALRRRVSTRTRELSLTLRSLQETENRFRTLYEQANDAIIIMQGAIVLDCNHRAEALYGIPRNMIVGVTLLSLSPILQPDGRRSEEVIHEMVAKADTGQVVVFEWRHVLPDGSPFDVEINLGVVDFGGKSCLQSIVRDITERKRAVEAIAESRNLLLKIIDTAPIRVFWKDRDLRFRGCNTLFAKDAGMNHPKDVIGKDDYQMVWEAQAELYRADDLAVMASGIPKLFYDEQQTTPGGQQIWLRTSKVPLRKNDNEIIGLLGIYEDITEHKRMEVDLATQLTTLNVLNREYKKINDKLILAQNQLLQSEKLAAIGLLSAGVAHEINNPISYVNSNLVTLKNYVDDLLAVIDAYESAEVNIRGATMAFAPVDILKAELDLSYLRSDVVTLMTESRDGLDRVKKIAQSLKDFARVDTAEAFREDDIQQGIESTLNVAWNELKYKCEVRKEYGDLPPVECLLAHLNQVFMNLLVNAAHAIERQGVITIRTGRKGEEVWVEISDTGKGIPAENLSRIFDPFFTTKPVGQGTGLGLSVSYGIVERHHGRIEVISEVGKGSTFRIWLPVKQPVGASVLERP